MQNEYLENFKNEKNLYSTIFSYKEFIEHYKFSIFKIFYKFLQIFKDDHFQDCHNKHCQWVPPLYKE